jgi:hypothetical protein
MKATAAQLLAAQRVSAQEARQAEAAQALVVELPVLVVEAASVQAEVRKAENPAAARRAAQRNGAPRAARARRAARVLTEASLLSAGAKKLAAVALRKAEPVPQLRRASLSLVGAQGALPQVRPAEAKARPGLAAMLAVVAAA